jgi:hypothetical protein
LGTDQGEGLLRGQRRWRGTAGDCAALRSITDPLLIGLLWECDVVASNSRRLSCRGVI